MSRLYSKWYLPIKGWKNGMFILILTKNRKPTRRTFLRRFVLVAIVVQAISRDQWRIVFAPTGCTIVIVLQQIVPENRMFHFGIFHITSNLLNLTWHACPVQSYNGAIASLREHLRWCIFACRVQSCTWATERPTCAGRWPARFPVDPGRLRYRTLHWHCRPLLRHHRQTAIGPMTPSWNRGQTIRTPRRPGRGRRPGNSGGPLELCLDAWWGTLVLGTGVGGICKNIKKKNQLAKFYRPVVHRVRFIYGHSIQSDQSTCSHYRFQLSFGQMYIQLICVKSQICKPIGIFSTSHQGIEYICCQRIQNLVELNGLVPNLFFI